MIKKAIAVMTSGGDSPGMNAAARAVVRTALYEGVKVYGINNGYQGMLDDDIEELTSRSVSDLIQRGGKRPTAGFDDFNGGEAFQVQLVNLPRRFVFIKRRGGGGEQRMLLRVYRQLIDAMTHITSQEIFLRKRGGRCGQAGQ